MAQVGQSNFQTYFKIKFFLNHLKTRPIKGRTRQIYKKKKLIPLPLLVIVIVKNWSLHHMNVQNVFLHGALNKEIFELLSSSYD